MINHHSINTEIFKLKVVLITMNQPINKYIPFVCAMILLPDAGDLQFGHNAELLRFSTSFFSLESRNLS
jgi:hypothetical protein